MLTENRSRSVRRPRLAPLDGLRLIAAVAVAVFHYAAAWRIDGTNPPEHFLPTASHVAIYGFLGVEVFFIISGFVICMSSWGRGLGHFFVSRASRLYPAYWACVIITAVVAFAAPITGGFWQMGEPTLDNVVVNLTMMQEPLGVPMIDNVYWTLFVELRFYLLFLVVVMMGVNLRRVVVFCAAWMTVAVMSPALSSRIVNVVAVPDYAPCFVAGIVMYLIYRCGRSTLLFAMLGFTYLLNLHHVTTRIKGLQPGFAVPVWPGLLLITVAYLLILAIALHWLDGIRWRWLTVAGAMTYPLYLLHQRVGYTAMRHLYQWVEVPVWLIVLMTLTGMLVLAWVVYRTVEVPLGGYLRGALMSSIDDFRATGDRTTGRALVRDSFARLSKLPVSSGKDRI